MADKDIEVQIGADSSGIHAGLSSASSAVKHAMDEINVSLTSSVAIGSAVGNMVSGVLVGAFDKLKNTLSELIPEVQKESEEVRKLANIFGATIEEANKLNIALEMAGIGGDAFVGMAMKLNRQLKTNEDGMNKLGVATRDSNGNLLAQSKIMSNAAIALNEYKAGTDRNAVAMQLFGRSASEAMELQRLNNDIQQAANELAEKGIGIDKQSVDAIRTYTIEKTKAGIVLGEFGNKIAESIVPMMTYLYEAFTRLSVSVLPVFSAIFQEVGIVFSAVGEVIKAVVDVIADVIDAVGQVGSAVFGKSLPNDLSATGFAIALMATQWTAAKVVILEVIELIRFHIDMLKTELVTAVKILDRVLHFDAAGAAAAFKQGTDNMIAVAKAHSEKMIQIAKDGSKKISDAWSGKSAEDKVSGGNKTAPDFETNGKDSAISASQKAALAQVAIEREKVQQLRALDKISEAEKTQKLIELANKEYSIELGTLDKLMAVHAGEKDKIATLEAQKLELKAKHGLEVLKLKDGLAKEEYKIDRQLTESAIDSAEKKSLAIIASERETLKHKRDLNQISLDEEIAGLLELTDREYAAQLKTFNAKLELYQNDKVQRQKVLNEITQAEQKHANDVTKIYQEAAKEQIKINRDMHSEKVSHDLEMKRLDIENQREILQIKVDLGQITEKQRLEALKKLLNDEYQAELEALNKKLALDDLTVVERQKVLNKISQLEKKHNNDLLKMDGDLAKEQNKIWKSLGNQISSLWDKGIQAMMNGTLTWRNAIRAIFTQLTGWFATEVVGKQIKAWILGENKMTAASLAGSAQRVAAKIGEAASGIAAMAGSVIKSILNFGAQTFAGVFAALSGIPIIGPALAASAAPAAMATVVGMTASVASASGGYDIPAGINPMTQLHQKEMVLPAKYADTIRSMADNGGGAGGEMQVHIHATDAQSVKRLFLNNKGALADALKSAARDFKK